MEFKDTVMGKALSKNGQISSKRVISFAVTFTLIGVFIYSTIARVEVSEFMFDSLTYLAMAALGSTAVDHFAKPSIQEKEDVETKETEASMFVQEIVIKEKE